MYLGSGNYRMSAKARAFSRKCEFVSLGCHKIVATCLDSLGLCRFSYPFDDRRFSIEDVIQFVETSFANFPDSVTTDESVQGTGIDEPVSAHKEDMRICIDRFLGRREEVPLDKPRIFVRAVNSSTEVVHAERLYGALRCKLPKARLYLLLLLDCQCTAGPVHFADTSDDLLFYRISDKFHTGGRVHGSLVRVLEMYGAAVTFAVRFWSFSGSDVDDLVVEAATICDAAWIFQEFSGGDPSTASFSPKRSGTSLCERVCDKCGSRAADGCAMVPTGTPCFFAARLSQLCGRRRQWSDKWSRFHDTDR